MEDELKINKDFPLVPFWKHLGIKIVDIKPGYGKIVMRAGPEHENPYGITHGGILSTLADSAAAVSVAGMIYEEGKRFVTVEMKINYLHPVHGGLIEAEARALREGRIVPAEVDIYNENILVAKAIATYIIVDEKRE